MTTKQLIDHIEGEANIYFDIEENKVAFATVAFPHFRGMESILQGKQAMDALVITPRVCGICGHAHLLAATRALESCYTNSGITLQLSQKAQKIREFTVLMEMVQNHFKWFYLTLMPELGKLSDNKLQLFPLKAAYAASVATKALAVFAGQWPHSSYMLPGGITTDPTYIEIMHGINELESVVKFMEKEMLGTGLDAFLSFESCKDFGAIDSDLAKVEKLLIDLGMHTKGMAYDRFVVLGEHRFSKSAKMQQTRAFQVDAHYVDTLKSYSPHEESHAKNALYKQKYYEVGPLARMMSKKVPLVRNMHRRFKDSAYTRVMARIYELGFILRYSLDLLREMRVDEPSYKKPACEFKDLDAEGIGVVEAPRGPLIHKTIIKQGVIQEYKIITPTQWNIGSSTQSNPTPVQKAMIGATKAEAMFIFRTFDVCSVCTTH